MQVRYKYIIWIALTAIIFESGPMPTPWKIFHVVNWVKTKPMLAGNQIPFQGLRLGFV